MGNNQRIFKFLKSPGALSVKQNKKTKVADLIPGVLYVLLLDPFFQLLERCHINCKMFCSENEFYYI